MKLIQTKDYLLLIDEEAEIKEGNYYLTHLGNIYQETKRPFEEDEGVERFTNRNSYKCILAYYPLTKEAQELDLPLLPNPFEGDVWVKGNRISVTTLYEYEERQDWPNHNKYKNLGYQTYIGEVIEVDKGLALKTDDGKIFKTQGTYWFGSILNQNCKLLKAAQSKQFTLEDMKKAMLHALSYGYSLRSSALSTKEEVEGNFLSTKTDKRIIQSLSTQQLPKEFIPEYDVIKDFNNHGSGEVFHNNMKEVLKTITNSKGMEVLVGTYKY